MLVHCRVLNINLERLSVDLSSKSSDLADKQGQFRYIVIATALRDRGGNCSFRSSQEGHHCSLDIP